MQKATIAKIAIYLCFWASFLLGRAISMVAPGEGRAQGGSSRIVIEAGATGWVTDPSLVELLDSARDYLGSECVVRLEVFPGKPGYIRQVQRCISETAPSHYLYDPRTGSQSLWRGIWEAFAVSALLAWYRITPITILMNLPLRQWRRQAGIITANRGVILTLMPSEVAMRFLPHRRIHGPMFMPFSQKRLEHIRASYSRHHLDRKNPTISFIGTVYEPRATLLKSIAEELSQKPVTLQFVLRHPDEPKILGEGYWSVLRGSDMTITTSEHILETGADAGIPPHLVYRYTEALVAETLLLAPKVPSPLIPGEHYVAYTSAKDLALQVDRLLRAPDEIERIRRSGAAFIEQRILGHDWWAGVSAALRDNPLVPASVRDHRG
ncbi:unannotated protein [freshwater metagenome]|uniref:Unannotated protein n=1 Tax=freshwater metagenome TaxID=449393 RepID=A0A6J6F0C0_9ZZZZ|nr:glycosyltransferase [Actinomycetota bacterium]